MAGQMITNNEPLRITSAVASRREVSLTGMSVPSDEIERLDLPVAVVRRPRRLFTSSI